MDLDLSGCVNLVDLELQDNYMTGRTLDFTNCTKLSHLRCENNGLAGIKVAGLSQLADLNCYSNQISSLDLSGCSSLSLVNAFSNALTSINTSGCSSLVQLNLANNQLQTLDVTDSGATLSVLGAASNQLTEVKGLGNCQALSNVNLNYNKLTKLTFANAPSLSEIQCQSNEISELKVENCPAVLNMDIYGNQLSRFDLTGMSIEVFPTGMFFYEGNKPDLQLKVWPEFDIDDKPSKWYGTATFVYEFTND